MQPMIKYCKNCGKPIEISPFSSPKKPYYIHTRKHISGYIGCLNEFDDIDNTNAEFDIQKYRDDILNNIL